MENKEKYTLSVQLITAVVALLGALGGAFLTANFALEGAKEQIKKELLVLSANNANENAKEIRKRSEEYLISLFELITFIDNERVYIDEANKRIAKMNQLAQGLLVYGGAELGAASLNLNLSLKNALIPTSKKEALSGIEAVMKSAKEWYPTYFTVISAYDNHTMPEKAKADFRNHLIESLFKGLNESIQPTANATAD